MVYSLRRLRRRPQIEDDLENEDDHKNEDALKNEDNLKNEDDLKNEDNLKNEDDLKNADPLDYGGLRSNFGKFPDNFLGNILEIKS